MADQDDDNYVVLVAKLQVQVEDADMIEHVEFWPWDSTVTAMDDVSGLLSRADAQKVTEWLRVNGVVASIFRFVISSRLDPLVEDGAAYR